MRLDGRKLGLVFIMPLAMMFSTLESNAQIVSDTTEGGFASQVLESAKEYRDRKIYNALTPAIISATPDKELGQVIVDYVRAKLNGSVKDELQVLNKESEVIRNVYIVSQIQSEVNNGGFNQLFTGSAVYFTDSAQKSFAAIKAIKHVEVLKDAIAQFKSEGVNDKLQTFDDQFFDLYDKENLNKLKISYIKKNKNSI